MDGSYLNNVYTKADSDIRYPVKAIDGTNTKISLDTKYRIQSDGSNFYIQRYDDDGVIISGNWVNVVFFTWNSNTNTSSIFMNGIDIVGNLSNTVDPGSLINYQPKLTVTKTTASPLSLSSSNVLTVDLTNYSTTILNNTLYQKYVQLLCHYP